MAQKKAFTPLKINISALEDSEARQELEMKYTGYRIQRQLAIETQRLSTISVEKSKSQMASAQIAFAEFLMLASHHFDEVQTEPLWIAYKSGSDVILESPFTEKDMRSGMRLQRKQMQQSASDLDSFGGENLYEEDENS
jgi:hypothetical protein